MAIYWTRTPEGIVVQDVWDFGVYPISTVSMAHLAQPDIGDSACLPPVPEEMWVGRRFAPVSNEVMQSTPSPQHQNLVRNQQALERLRPDVKSATLWMVSHPDSSQLYASNPRPQLRIASSDLAATLVDLPSSGDVPLQDFVLDFGSILYAVNETVCNL